MKFVHSSVIRNYLYTPTIASIMLSYGAQPAYRGERGKANVGLSLGILRKQREENCLKLNHSHSSLDPVEVNEAHYSLLEWAVLPFRLA